MEQFKYKAWSGATKSPETDTHRWNREEKEPSWAFSLTWSNEVLLKSKNWYTFLNHQPWNIIPTPPGDREPVLIDDFIMIIGAQEEAGFDNGWMDGIGVMHLQSGNVH